MNNDMQFPMLKTARDDFAYWVETINKVSGRKREVLARLMAADGKWVGGPELANRRCGGSEGLRRLRELRELGYVIEKKKLEGDNYFSYRFVG